MTICSDNWIRRKCTKPSHYVYVGAEPRKSEESWVGITDTQEVLDDLVRRYHAMVIEPGMLTDWQPMISPFEFSQVRVRDDQEKVISYGTSSYGYDVRLADKFKIFTNINSQIIDPKRFDPKCLVDGEVLTDDWGDQYVILPPNSYLLGHTMETFVIPKNVMIVCLGKSTYARSGAIVNVTPIEAGFEGVVVIEVSNSTNLPLKIYVGEGIAQFLFFEAEEFCAVSYKDRGGKYQNQIGIVTPLV